jgi:hypothetical protein
MNGRGYKRAADEDILCVRKKLKIGVDVTVEDPGGVLVSNPTGFDGLTVNGPLLANGPFEVVPGQIVTCAEITARPAGTLTLRSENNACQVLIGNSQIVNSCQTTIQGSLLVDGTVSVLNGNTVTGLTKDMVGLDQVDNQSVATTLTNPEIVGIASANYIKVKSDGNQAAPSIYWGNDTDTGISHQEDVVCISTAGVNNACFRTNGIQINKGDIYFQTPGGLVDTVQVATLKSDHDAHVADVLTNPHAVTKADVGLTNVDDQSVVTILNNSALTGATTAENIIASSTAGTAALGSATNPFGPMFVSGDITVGAAGSALKGHLLEETVDATNIVAGAGAVNNTLLGKDVGTLLTTGDDNTLMGFEAGKLLTDDLPVSNTVMGAKALAAANNATYCTIIGAQAAQNATGPSNSTCIGFNAGSTGDLGGQNTLVGSYSGFNVQGGQENTYVGYDAGRSSVSGGGDNNVAVGQGAFSTITTGSSNTGLGDATQCSPALNYQVSLGSEATCDAANQMTIGGTDSTNANPLLKNAILEVRPGSTDSTCALGSTTNPFGAMFVSGDVTVGGTGSTLKGFLLEERINGSNMVAGNGAGVALTATSDGNLFIGKDAGAAVGNLVDHNTIIGTEAGPAVSQGQNTIIGYHAGFTKNSGQYCTLVGVNAGADCNANTTAIGADALLVASTTGNTAVGYKAGVKQGTGTNNVYVGLESGVNHSSGTASTFVGYNSGASSLGTVQTSVAIGANSKIHTGGTRGIALGNDAKTTTDRQMVIGSATAGATILEVIPGSLTNECSLGSSTNRFGTVYCDNLDPEGTISVSLSGPIVASQGVVKQFSRVDTTSGAVTMTLPNVFGIDGLEYHIYHAGGTNQLDMFTTSSQQIKFSNGTGGVGHTSYTSGGTYSFMAINTGWLMRSATPVVCGELSNTSGMLPASGTDVVIEFDTKGVEWGTTVAIDTTNRITVKYTGRYQITGTFSIRSDSTVEVRDIFVFATKNVNVPLANCTSACALEGTPTTDYQTVSYSGIVDLVANDYIQARFTDGGATDKTWIKYGTLSVVGLNGQW